MSASAWAKFDSKIDATKVNETKDMFAKIDAGVYTVTVESAVLKEDKHRNPMLQVVLKTVDTGMKIYYNKSLIVNGREKLSNFNTSSALTFLEGILGEYLPFKGYEKFAEYATQAGEVTRELNLKVSYNDKGYAEYSFVKGEVGESLELEMPDVVLY